MAFYRGGVKWSSVLLRRAGVRSREALSARSGLMERRCGTRHLSAIVVCGVIELVCGKCFGVAFVARAAVFAAVKVAGPWHARCLAYAQRCGRAVRHGWRKSPLLSLSTSI